MQKHLHFILARPEILRDLHSFMKARVTIMPQSAVLDPAGVATAHALEHLGFQGVQSVRIGKSIELEITGATLEELDQACRDLLSNPVMEEYRLEILS
jgi:phosphoribosylformylglycinamidine synthase